MKGECFTLKDREDDARGLDDDEEDEDEEYDDEEKGDIKPKSKLKTFAGGDDKLLTFLLCVFPEIPQLDWTGFINL